MTLTEFIDSEFGPLDNPKRVALENNPWQINLGFYIVHERKAQNLSIKEFTDRGYLMPSLLQTIEQDTTDVNYTLLYKIIEEGLGHKVEIDIK